MNNQHCVLLLIALLVWTSAILSKILPASATGTTPTAAPTMSWADSAVVAPHNPVTVVAYWPPPKNPPLRKRVATAAAQTTERRPKTPSDPPPPLETQINAKNDPTEQHTRLGRQVLGKNDNGQCVRFVRFTTGIDITGNANTWSRQAKTRVDLVVDNSTPPADTGVVQTNESRAGHVAEYKRIGGGKLKLTERNVLGRYVVSERIIDEDDPRIVAFIAKKSAVPPGTLPVEEDDEHAANAKPKKKGGDGEQHAPTVPPQMPSGRPAVPQ